MADGHEGRLRRGTWSYHHPSAVPLSRLAPVILRAMVAAREFSEQQVQAAIDFVIEHGAENRGQTVYYTQVFSAAGFPEPQLLHQRGESEFVTRFMKAFHDRCTASGLPPLDSLVVHVAGPRGGFPGRGYFAVNGWADPLDPGTQPSVADRSTRSWQEQQGRCRAWGHGHRRSRGS